MSGVQKNEPTRTQTENQNANENDDNHNKSSSLMLQSDYESNRKTTSDALNNDNPSTPETEATTNESTNVSIPETTNDSPTKTIASGNNQSSPHEDFQPTTKLETSKTETLDSNENKHTMSTHDDVASSPSRTEIPNPDANMQSLPALVQPVGTTESSTSRIPDSDVINQSEPTEVQPTISEETSTTQTPIVDSNKQSLPKEIQPVVSVKPSVTKIPVVEANKQAATIATHDLNETSTPKDAISNQESTSVDQTSLPKANSDIDTSVMNDLSKISSPKIQQAIDSPTQNGSNDFEKNKEISQTKPTTESDRKHLVSLIEQELNFVGKICPKLGEHQDHIKKEMEEAKKQFMKLKDEPCEIKELKDLKKTVTKLKLQIPAKYRTYDESDRQKNRQTDVEKGGAIPIKLLKEMPRLHNKLFQESTICKTFQERYNKLSCQLKLCLLCFSVFPENETISRRLMVYWWIGEGLIPLEEDLEEELGKYLAEGSTTEDRANHFFKILMDHDFIEAISRNHNRYVATCKMHPMVRAALIMIADKVNFFDFDEFGNPKDLGKFDEIDSPDEIPNIYPLGDPREFFDFYDKYEMPTTDPIEFFDSYGNPTPFVAKLLKKEPDDTQNKVIDSKGKEVDISKKYYFYRKKSITSKSYKVCLMGSGLSKGIIWENLHMLFNVKDDILEFKPEWFLRMKNVNVLLLGRWQSSAAHHIEVEEFDFNESLDHLNHVRFFSLQGVSRISEIPNSISKLESLLILDLRACHNLEVIPNTIGSLKCLTHLDMSECYLLKDIPKEISSLESLQVLKGFVVVDSSEKHVCTLQDLTKLVNLKKLSMYTHMKQFPEVEHLEALQKFESLRKLTILWGVHASKPEHKSKKAIVNPKKSKLASRVMKRLSKKKWVGGSIRRMNAFNNSTLGSRLEKLDLKCFPDNNAPNWLTPGSLKGLKKLYIRGGKFSDLGQYQDILVWEDSTISVKETWNVEVLRLKYLDNLKMEWRELQNLFPNMTSLEKVNCPRLTLFPCNERGVWTKTLSTTM